MDKLGISDKMTSNHHDHRRSSCDELLTDVHDSENESERLTCLEEPLGSQTEGHRPLPNDVYYKATLTRCIALLCACSLSIGSH